MLPILTPVVLSGKHVELQPLAEAHGPDLSQAVGDLHTLWVTSVPTADTVADYIREAIQLRNAGQSLPFAMVEKHSGRAIGSTRFANIRREHRSVEIGWTWISAPWQRTAVNTEAKYLLLGYAFEALRCIRVELKTDVLNERSRRAIERLGAKQDGIFRKHMIMPNGRIRDSVYYSIVDDDWPHVKAHLETKLAAVR